MHQDFPKWLAEQQYAEGTQNTQITRVKKIEKAYGSLEQHLKDGSYQQLIDSLIYSANDERENKPNPSKIEFNGSIKKNLQSYKDAALRYFKFLNDTDFFTDVKREETHLVTIIATEEDEKKQKLSLERDMQAALRANITSLEPGLQIIDEGAERYVDSGRIDITCEDSEGIVIIELKAGTADSGAIGQILGYMGDVQEQEGKPVRGILVAHDFNKRTRSAARVVPSLKLKKYSIQFKFTEES